MISKKYVQAFVLLIFTVSVVSCSSSNKTSSSRTPSSTRTSKSQYPVLTLPGAKPSTAGLPPGQAKKIHGEQSAKAFAPGQQKKAQKQKGKKAKKK